MIYPTEIYKQIIDRDSIDQINLSINDHLLNPEKKVVFDYGTYYSVGEKAESILKSLLPRLPNEELHVFLLESTFPPLPHRDRHFIEGRTYVVPIEECDPETITTIVFNETQTLQESNDQFFENAPDVPSNFSQDFRNTHLGHVPQEKVNKLSIETIFPYVLGDAIVFDSSKVHCSNDYRSQKISKKRGILVWSNILEDGKDRPNLYNDKTKSSRMPPIE